MTPGQASHCSQPLEFKLNKKLRVLVVDDLESNRRGVMAVLEFAEGIEVTHQARNGWLALQIVAEEQPDVVLMDVRMPIMSGLEATRQIKQRWPQVKVIVLTMYASYKAEALAAGADWFLLKGTSSGSLEDIIRGVASSGKQELEM
jgi:YesN/AraC family two-component response regulator